MDWLERLNRSAGRAATGSVGVEVLRWNYNPHLTDNVPHRHTFFEVCLVGARGQGRFLVGGQPRAIGPGDLFIARPGVVHQIENTAAPNMELFWVSFARSHAPTGEPDGRNRQSEIRDLGRAFADSNLLVTPDEYGKIGAAWRALRAVCSDAPRCGFEMQVEALSRSLLLSILQAGSQTPPTAEPPGANVSQMALHLALRYIQDNIGRKLPVDEIAAHLHVSPRHLNRLFVQGCGTSPAAYIERARLDRAMALLQNGMPIKEVALGVGYADVQHFTRVFSRRAGVSPARFRRGETGDVRKVQTPGALV